MTEMMTAAALKSLLDTLAACALIDVREPGEYNDAHIPGASLVPRRQLEFRMARLVPWNGTQVIVCDDGVSICVLSTHRSSVRERFWRSAAAVKACACGDN